MNKLGTSKAWVEPRNGAASTSFTVATSMRENTTCYRCGKTGHNPTVCRHKDTVCHGCGKEISRLLARVTKAAPTRAGQSSLRKTTQAVNNVDKSKPEQEEQELSLYNITSGKQSRPLKISVQIEDQTIPMEIDTGTRLSLVSEAIPTGRNGQIRLWNRAVRNCTHTQESPYL